MAIHVALTHRTTYRFDRSTEVHPHILRLRPAVHSRTPILSYSLNVKPADHFINWQQDPFGNYMARLVFPERTTELEFEVSVIADMTVLNPFDFFVEESANKVPFEYGDRLKRDLAPYLEIMEDGPQLREWVAGIDFTPPTTVDFLVALNQRLAADIAYTIRMEPGVQTCEQTLGKALGSCRDTGWVLVQVLRHLGLAARFVSGYLVQLTADVKALDGPSGPEADFTDLHAWAEVYIPGAGWVGLDPTSGLFAGEGHIPLSCTPEPSSAAPITGSTGPCEVEFSFSNTVTRLHEDPRVTKPYSESQWQGIRSLGDAVDAELAEGDVRLTMGGEPTFVSIDDMEAAEWNIAADGPHKRRLAEQLTRRMREEFAPGGILHYGQGKWYPGEALPRWQKACYWRADGEPVWSDPDLLGAPDVPAGQTVDDAEHLVRDLAAALKLPAEAVMPAYEDPVVHLLQESRMPANLDTEKADLKDPAERRRLARLLTGDLNEPVGWVLPMEHSELMGRWQTSSWPLRRERLVLLPGDSSIGFRLPLDSLPWKRETDTDIDEQPRDPFDEHGDLPAYEAPPARAEDDKPAKARKGDKGDKDGKSGKGAAGGARGETTRERKAAAKAKSKRKDKKRAAKQAKAGSEDTVVAARPRAAPLTGNVAPDGKVIKTALAVEARAGVLHVFLPPLTTLEAWLELVAAMERIAVARNCPIVLEGYDPPRDPRLLKFAVTPDPGVIEVNIHPSGTFDELVANNERLHELARECRLGTEKFMLDGRHTGTGGGNHVTLGAASPADSPLLRKPSLLRSLITYWQNHPSLSYLFSGMFIGPTSQAPRVDEARDDRLYELEIAFSQLPESDTSSPWLIDRVLRNLLTDLTGNTHRSEFCIDKLYSPDSATGRLGLLELRAFEMPPHPRMSIVQILLLRSLIAMFWKQPLKRSLVHWGTTLHDRFMLPQFIWEDIRDVVADLRQAGYDFDLQWLAPFYEFRFPYLGSVESGDVHLEVRGAIEPWHVLGEEATGSGTARYVDSSVERVQVKVSGLVGDRYQIACNGRRVPLRATGVKGEGVAGVRYKAWDPPSALHPTIGADTPLVFDIVDSWNGRSIGGCTYHVSHAGGRSYDTFPVNAYEAEARRVTRFWNFGHTAGPLEPQPIPVRTRARSVSEGPTTGRFVAEGSAQGPMEPPPAEVNPDYPLTLDLRRG
ncbi:MAG TPA: transglutaminase family protein [Pseudomonadales bacterium]|nr:transglutaminase family protein [Pseudomonadales bacterium]